MSLTKTTYSMIDGPALNIKDFGAVGDGIANDTSAFLAFKAACVAQGAKGVLPAGNYLIDAFSFTGADAGLILEGPTFNFASPSTGPSGPGYFGGPIAVLRLRNANAYFVQFDGAYNLQISNLAFDGNQFADNVFYFPGVANNTYLTFNFCEFYGATPTTGVVHRYDGTLGGDHCYFNTCFLYQYHNIGPGPNRAAFCINNTNTNAFLINYTDCFFAQADILIQYNQGSCNLFNCFFSTPETGMIQIVNICQPFICSYCYHEGAVNKFFINQVFNVGATSYYPITIINPIMNATGVDINLTCQQPVNIYGGFIGGDINVNATPTWGLAHHTFDSVAFNTGDGIKGSESVTQVNQRNCSINNVYQPNQTYGGLNLLGLNDSNNEGATINVTNKQWVNVSNSGAQNITGLTGGLTGQTVTLFFADANSTLVNGADFNLSGSTNVTPTARSVITFLGSGAAPGLTPAYWAEISRSIK